MMSDEIYRNILDISQGAQYEVLHQSTISIAQSLGRQIPSQLCELSTFDAAATLERTLFMAIPKKAVWDATNNLPVS